MDLPDGLKVAQSLHIFIVTDVIIVPIYKRVAVKAWDGTALAISWINAWFDRRLCARFIVFGIRRILIMLSFGATHGLISEEPSLIVEIDFEMCQFSGFQQPDGALLT
jgi:hypothetical protein